MNGWRKSSRSVNNGACAEIGGYRKSSASHANNGCIEAGGGTTVIGVRDTKEAHLGDARTVLEFPPGAWAEFTGKIKSGVSWGR